MKIFRIHESWYDSSEFRSTNDSSISITVYIEWSSNGGSTCFISPKHQNNLHIQVILIVSIINLHGNGYSNFRKIDDTDAGYPDEL